MTTTTPIQLIPLVLYYFVFSHYCSVFVSANCPPSVVSSFEELHEYCPDASAENGDYACYKHDRVVCKGTIDHRHTPPFCTHATIRDCSDDQYYRVCAYGHKNCNHRADFTFVCWDKQQGHWCQGTIEPDKGTRTHPVCPREAVYDCGELYRYGLNVDRDCDCSGFFGGPVQYECRDSSGHKWCSYKSNFFFGGGGHSSSWTWNALWMWGTPSSREANNHGGEYTTTRSGGLGFFVVIAVVAALGVFYRRSKPKRRATSCAKQQQEEEQRPLESTSLLSPGKQ